VAYIDLAGVGVGDFLEFERVFDAAGDRFFDHDQLAGLDRLDRMFDMVGGTGGDGNQLDIRILQELCRIGIDLRCREFLLRGGAAFRIDVASGDDFVHFRVLPDFRDMHPVPGASEAPDSDPNFPSH